MSLRGAEGTTVRRAWTGPSDGVPRAPKRLDLRHARVDRVAKRRSAAALARPAGASDERRDRTGEQEESADLARCDSIEAAQERKL